MPRNDVVRRGAGNVFPELQTKLNTTLIVSERGLPETLVSPHGSRTGWSQVNYPVCVVYSCRHASFRWLHRKVESNHDRFHYWSRKLLFASSALGRSLWHQITWLPAEPIISENTFCIPLPTTDFLADWVARLADWVDLTSWPSSQGTGITNKSFLGQYSSQPWSNMASWVSIVFVKFPCLWKRIQLQPFVRICVWELSEIISTISCDKTYRHNMQLFFLYFRYRFFIYYFF